MPRLCLVADIHHGADHMTKKGSDAARLMQDFRAFVAESRPDAVIDLGDRISDRDRETDLRLEREAAEMFAPLSAPRHHLDGNHDRDHLTVEENDEILGRGARSETAELDGWTLVLWRADTRIRRPGGFVLPEADLLWLAGVVAQATKPLCVVSHVPVSGHDQTGNYYFERNPEASTYPGAWPRALAVLQRARVPVICVAGHVHWNTVTFRSGQPHLTLQSLTETFTTHPEPAGAFALLELGEQIAWTVHGADPFALRMPAAAAARRWVEPLPPFHEHPEIRAKHLEPKAAE